MKSSDRCRTSAHGQSTLPTSIVREQKSCSGRTISSTKLVATPFPPKGGGFQQNPRYAAVIEPPDTLVTSASRFSQPNSLSRQRLPRWNRAALKPPPDRASPVHLVLSLVPHLLQVGSSSCFLLAP